MEWYHHHHSCHSISSITVPVTSDQRNACAWICLTWISFFTEAYAWTLWKGFFLVARIAKTTGYFSVTPFWLTLVYSLFAGTLLGLSLYITWGGTRIAKTTGYFSIAPFLVHLRFILYLPVPFLGFPLSTTWGGTGWQWEICTSDGMIYRKCK